MQSVSLEKAFLFYSAASAMRLISAASCAGVLPSVSRTRSPGQGGIRSHWYESEVLSPRRRCRSASVASEQVSVKATVVYPSASMSRRMASRISAPMMTTEEKIT